MKKVTPYLQRASGPCPFTAGADLSGRYRRRRGMGEIIPWKASKGPRPISVAAVAQSDIVSVAVVRNGQTVCEQKPENWNTTFNWIDAEELDKIALDSKHLGRFVYYYIRVTTASGAQAWSSPVWIASIDPK